MKFLFSILFASGILLLNAQDFTFNYSKDYPDILKKSNDPKNALFYDSLLVRFNSDDTTMTNYEVLALLIGFTDNSYFKPYSYLTTERRIYSLNDKGEYKKALQTCDSFLRIVPVSQKALAEKSYAFSKLGNDDSSEIYLKRFYRIMETMSETGNGLSPETAIFSLGPADGQDFIRRYLKCKIGTMGSGSDKDGNFLDILEIIIRQEGQDDIKAPLYFVIQHATKTMFSELNLDDSGNDKKKKKRKKDK